MLIKSIRLNNIRSYLDEEIIFPRGSVLLSGDIGAGKSTILLAIEFALFGILRSELTGNSLLRNGKNSGYVELTFELEDKDVTIKRTLKRTKDSVKQESGQIAIGGTLMDLTPQELKAKILELLGYPDELLTSAKSLIYRYTVYTPQEEMKKIIFDDEKERLNTLRRVFGIDRYKRIVENSEIVARKISEEIRASSGRIFDLQEKLSQKESMQGQLEILNEKMGQLMPEFRKSYEIMIEKKKVVAEAEKRTTEINELKKDFDVLKAKLSEKEIQEKKILAEIEKSKKEIALFDEKIRQAPEVYTENFEASLAEEEKKYLEKLDQRSSVAAKKAESESRKKELKEELEIFEKTLKESGERKIKALKLREVALARENIEAKINSLRKSMDELRESIAIKDALRKSALELKNKIHTLDKCPVCSQTIFLGQKKAIEKEQEEQIEITGKELSELLLEKENIESGIRDFDSKIKEIGDAEKELERIEGMLSNSRFVEESYSSKQKFLLELDEKIEKFSQKLSELAMDEMALSIARKKEIMGKIKEAEFAKKNLADRKDSISQLEKNTEELKKEKSSILMAEADIVERIKLVGNCEQMLAEARNDLEFSQEMLKKIELEKVSIEKDIENSDKILKALSGEINDKLEVKKQIEALKEKQSWLRDRLVPLVRLTESQIMQAVHEEFDSIFRNWASVLLEDESINLKIQENFGPVAEQNGFFLDIADLSGGEKTSCALAYRLALNKVVNDIMSAIKTKNILILDEPTDGFSSEQLDKVRDVLEQLSASQIILVSHEAKLESFVDNIIRIGKIHSTSRVIA